MGGQNIERREALRIIGMASAAAGFPGFRKWKFACAHDLSAVSEDLSEKTQYQPIFFSEPQYKLISRIAEMIIPADDSPGAIDAGVPEFIDFMMANRVAISGFRRGTRSWEPPFRNTEEAIEAGQEAQERFVSGLGWVDTRCFSEFGHAFLDCTPQQQNMLLEELAYKDKFKPLTESGREFFDFVRSYTVVGYYTSKVGLEALGFPGLRTVWPSLPACSHPDDPEHVRLSLPASEHA